MARARVLTLLMVSQVVVFAYLGVWMVASPDTWYEKFPAKLHETGPFNWHFVGDIGLVYVQTALVAAWCARSRCQHPAAYTAYLVVALWQVFHGLWHVYEIVTGRQPSSRWVTDIPVWAGSILNLVLAIPHVWTALGGAMYETTGTGYSRVPGSTDGGEGGGLAMGTPEQQRQARRERRMS